MRIIALTESELEDLLVRSAKLGASHFRDELNKQQTPEIMIKAQVAEYLSVSIPTVDRYMAKGLPYFKEDNGHPRFRKSEIDAWVSRRTH